MGLKKGSTNNPNGRPKGSLNRSTEELRNTVQAFIEKNIEGMQDNFDMLEPKEKLQFIEKMLNFSLPRLQATQLTTFPDNDMIVLSPIEREKKIKELRAKLFENKK